MIDYLGWIALLLFMVGGLYKQPRTTMLFAIAGNFCFALSYFLTEKYVPAASIGGNVIYAIIVRQIDARHLKTCLYIYAVFCTTMISIHIAQPIDVLILLAGWAMAFANYNRDNYINYKSGILLSQAMWITYTLYFADYPMLICSSMIVMANGYSLLRNAYKDGYPLAFTAKRAPVKVAAVQNRVTQNREL